MKKTIKKILISVLIMFICISPLAKSTFNNGNVQATVTPIYTLPTVTPITLPTITPTPTSTPTPTPTTTPAPEGITRERVYSYEDSATTGFQYYIHVGNVTYTHYYQIRGFYKNDYIAAWDSTICNTGCGITSCSILLSGYGVTLNPRQVLQESGGSFGIIPTLSRHGVTRFLVWK